MDIFLPPIVASSREYNASATVADFHYDIALPDGNTRPADIEARIPASERIPFQGSFEDAVAAAMHQQEWLGPIVDGTHPTPIYQTIGIQSDRSGNLFLGRLSGFHRDRIGPMFLDGTFFENNARKVTITSRGDAADGMRLLGIVGQHAVADLRRSDTVTFVNTKTPHPDPPKVPATT